MVPGSDVIFDTISPYYSKECDRSCRESSFTFTGQCDILRILSRTIEEVFHVVSFFRIGQALSSL